MGSGSDINTVPGKGGNQPSFSGRSPNRGFRETLLQKPTKSSWASEVPRSAVTAKGMAPLPIQVAARHPEEKFTNGLIPATQETTATQARSLVGQATNDVRQNFRESSSVARYGELFYPSNKATKERKTQQAIAPGIFRATPSVGTRAHQKRMTYARTIPQTTYASTGTLQAIETKIKNTPIEKPAPDSQVLIKQPTIPSSAMTIPGERPRTSPARRPLPLPWSMQTQQGGIEYAMPRGKPVTEPRFAEISESLPHFTRRKADMERALPQTAEDGIHKSMSQARYTDKTFVTTPAGLKVPSRQTFRAPGKGNVPETTPLLQTRNANQGDIPRAVRTAPQTSIDYGTVPLKPVLVTSTAVAKQPREVHPAEQHQMINTETIPVSTSASTAWRAVKETTVEKMPIEKTSPNSQVLFRQPTINPTEAFQKELMVFPGERARITPVHGMSSLAWANLTHNTKVPYVVPLGERPTQPYLRAASPGSPPYITRRGVGQKRPVHTSREVGIQEMVPEVRLTGKRFKAVPPVPYMESPQSFTTPGTDDVLGKLPSSLTGGAPQGYASRSVFLTAPQQNAPIGAVSQKQRVVTNSEVAMQPYAALPAEQAHALQIRKKSPKTLISASPGISEEARVVPRNIATFERTGANTRLPAKHSPKASAHSLQEAPRYIQSPQIPQNLGSRRGGKHYAVHPSSGAGIPGKVPEAYFTDATSTRMSGRSLSLRVPRAVTDFGTLLPLQTRSTLQRNVPHAVLSNVPHPTMPFENVPEKQHILTSRGAAKQHVGLSPVEQAKVVHTEKSFVDANRL
ncbi:uncharacterized protein LOC119446092 isoform X1 [Dermacentor silvarum]|uniref:uncharacterized protein LOC119446092 isoform X1 n=1 Tax=Dermacentor silvarum TaxID=543639 RepID=UPI002100A410|nr:uncharacterized protein LOC119446092 isoform X1 [Dermacentor silvarum]